mmetsp:Transcript_40674/g.95581  ORF Transcript_40674/g.95581 Transcript_40674/m.95581 type:complete len:91 (-) Transcript_40674:256-528(-)
MWKVCPRSQARKIDPSTMQLELSHWSQMKSNWTLSCSPLGELHVKECLLVGHLQLHSGVQGRQSVILFDIVEVATYSILALFERMILLDT